MIESFEQLLNACEEGKTTPRDDSRKVSPGDVFVAVKGEALNGADYIPQAIAAGAIAILAQRDAMLPEGALGGVPVIRVDDARYALAELARRRWSIENAQLKVLGVTGTNGKTTITYLLEKLFASQGSSAGVIGTVNCHWPGHVEDAPLTTPGTLALHEKLWQISESGAEWAMIEVSSHALAQKRAAGVDFAGALFTNLTQDHLDFHTDMENYFKAKASLFLELPKKDKPLAINADDHYGRRLLELLPDAMSFGLRHGFGPRRHLRGEILSSSIQGLHLKMSLDKKIWRFRSPLVGEFNALNLLGAQALALQLGVEPEQMECLEDFHGVPGRLERVQNSRSFNIFVDYAHTPDALVNVLKALKNSGFKRIITVFGCGGNRDRTKRPLMGKAVAEHSDVAIVTSDNPRMEEPEAIIKDILPGLARARKTIVEPDRRLATQKAIELLGPEDALLIAGKGHENYQIIKGQRFHYSDQETARELSESL